LSLPGSLLLEGRRLSRRFGGVLALHEVDLCLRPGEALGVIGPNGAGKSTLANVLSGVLAPSSGQVLMGGKDLTGAAPWRFARAGLARTFQVMRPLRAMSVEENLLLAARYAGQRRARESHPQQILERVGLGARAGVDSASLAVADARRLELARALAAAPAVLVLDELLAGLSAEDISFLLDLLLDLKASGLAMVMVEHHLLAVRALCDQILVLDGGKGVARGSAHEILSDPGAARVYLGTGRGLR